MLDLQTRHHLVTGRDEFAAGNYDAAAAHLSAVLRHHEGFADVHNMLGVIAHQQGRAEEARQHFNRALEQNPHYTEAALHLAICLNEIGLYAEAREVYRAATIGRQRPTEPLKVVDEAAAARLANLHADLGDCYLALGEAERAAAEYQEALARRPSYPDIRLKLGVAWRDAGLLEHSLLALGELCERHPEYVPGRLQLGLTLRTLGRVGDARRHWQWVLDHDPGNARAAFYLAQE